MISTKRISRFVRQYSSIFSHKLNRPSISAGEYVSRRSQLLQLLRDAAKQRGVSSRKPFALLLSQPKTFSAPEVPHVYRQCSNFRYLSGIEQPGFRLLVGPDESVLFTEGHTEHQILWDGPGQSEEQLKEISSIEQVLPLGEFEKYVAGTLRADGLLAVNLDSLADQMHVHADLKTVYSTLASGGWTHISLNEQMDLMRWRKSAAEQEIMRESCRIGSEAINAMLREFREPANESHIVGFLEYQSRLRGANFLAYPPVVAGGANANTIHYISANMPIRSTDCVLVDSGCDVDGYVSDITRCFPSSGKFSDTQRSLYDALCYVQLKLLEYVESRRPLRLNELYTFMLEQMADALGQIVFFRGNLSREEMIAECDKLCPHHVSHYLGMDVHDTPSIPRTIDCRPGVIITVEPGIYVRLENSMVREEFKGIGFRIEDDVLLTESGVEILSANCIRSSDEIENAFRV